MLMKGVASYLEFMILGVVSCSESKAGTSEQKQKWKSEQQKLITRARARLCLVPF